MTKPALNPLVANLSSPPIPAAQSWAKAYQGDYGPLIDLSQAVPGYPPHPEMLRLLGEAASSADYAGYGAIEGEKNLREAYSKHLSALYKANLTAENIHITSGCNQAFIAAVMSIAKAGDTVLMTEPFYFNHQSSLEMLGIKWATVPCEAKNSFVPDKETLLAHLHNGVKAVALVSPNNPTGAVYPPELLKEIFNICQEKAIWLLLDETYRDFLEDPEQAPHQLFQLDNWQDGLIQLYSFSKSFCIPGHRLGAVTASADIISNIAKIMDNLQICAPRAPQHAVAQAIEPLEAWRNENRKEITLRADALRKVMDKMPEWKIEAIGAYFAFVRHPFPQASSMKVAQALAEQLGIITLPGVFFGDGQDEYLRFAFANADSATIQLLEARLPFLKVE